LATALVGGEWSASRLGRFTPEERAHSGWAPEMVWTTWWEVLSLPVPELLPLGCPAAVPTALSINPQGETENAFGKGIYKPITVAAQSKAWIVFARSNTGIVGANSTRGMDVCVR
jgi:hypothetical protein